MRTDDEVETRENEFLFNYMEAANKLVCGDSSMDNAKFKMLSVAAIVVARNKHTRGLMKALNHQILMDTGRKALSC